MRFGRLCLLACVALLGCASSEGGVTGTGVSAVSGNIVLVSDQSDASVTLPFPVRVTIAEAPGIESTTDADGVFQLSGAFSGAITLQFANAIEGVPIGPLTLEVPVGSQTILENIVIRTTGPEAERVQPQAVRQFDVFGRVDMVDCDADGTGVVLVTDQGRPPRQVLVRLTPDTEIAARDGAPLTCGDLRASDTVRVSGLLRRDDGSIIALLIVVGSPRPPKPEPTPRPERLRGVVEGVTCARGLIEIEQRGADPVRRIVRLTDGTEFLCEGGVPDPCDCSAIDIGAQIAVAGTIFPSRPGQILADVVVLGAAVVPVVGMGPITRLACANAGLGVEDTATGETLRVALTPETVITCRGGLLCRCSALRVRQRVRVDGVRSPGGGTVTAERVTVLGQRQAP